MEVGLRIPILRRMVPNTGKGILIGSGYGFGYLCG